MSNNTITVKLVFRVLETAYKNHPLIQEIQEDVETTIPENVVNTFENLVERLNDLPDMTLDAQTHKTLGLGDVNTIDVWLAHTEIMNIVFETDDNVLGVFNTTQVLDNLFDDEGPMADNLRCVIGWNKTHLQKLFLQDVCSPDETHNLMFEAEAWLNTLTHEIAHALLFCKHSGGHSPATIDMSECDIEHSLFDVLTGYGIAPLTICGKPHWSESADEALNDMEEAVEEWGKAMLQKTVSNDDLDQILKSLDLLSEHA